MLVDCAKEDGIRFVYSVRKITRVLGCYIFFEI
jgi:hypothetical protein